VPTRRSDFQICGIAGYSVDTASSVDRTLAAQALLAGIAERGADAVGYAFRGLAAGVTVHKQRTGASELLDAVSLPPGTTQALVHVRDFTKGHPTISANNHPIRHGSVVGIHNGIIENDEEIFARYRFNRAEPEMTVDSEAIFALMNATEGDHRALEELFGAMATAWLDERDGEVLVLARGLARPLWLGRGRRELFFASTRTALEVVESTLRVSLRKTALDEGRMLRVRGGRVVDEQRFRPDRSYREDNVLPAVRTPHEGASCLARLAVIAATV
jgi:glutamine---fructose-6-phosphate transaminase (isomerizing)